MRNHDFSHVLWIGGSVCSGKTSAAKDLASRYGLRIYSFDGAEPFHIYRSVPERQPNLIRFMAMTMDERWVLRTPEAMAEHALAAWSEERFPMVLDDLRHLPGSGAVIAEGAGLLPQKVAPLMTDHRCALWLVATPDCIRQVRTVRGEGVSQATSDSRRAFENPVWVCHGMPGNPWNSIWPRSPIYDANASDADRDASLRMLANVDATLVLCGHIPGPHEYRDQLPDGCDHYVVRAGARDAESVDYAVLTRRSQAAARGTAEPCRRSS